jgi:uncharacterized protein (TIGR03032 family)
MKLETEFCKLPLQFDADRLSVEVAQFSETDWRAHPEGHRGNSALPLIAVEGNPANDSVKGVMRPTPHLDRCPYLRQVLASLETVLGRTRLMRIDAGGEATSHVDTNYYWMQRVRVHIPIVTFPEVQFLCGDRSVHMAAGETWIFDTWRRHNVINPTANARIHLVSDTVGSTAFWDLVAQGGQPLASDVTPPVAPRYISYESSKELPLILETVNFPVVMTPWEQLCLLSDFFTDLKQSSQTSKKLVAKLEAEMERFHRHWKALWMQYGDRPEGWADYRQALDQMNRILATFERQMVLPNGSEAIEILRQAVMRSALNPELAKPAEAEPIRVAAVPQVPPTPTAPPTAKLDRPIFIVSAPRSGSTLLFELLSRSPSVYTIGDESHLLFESIPSLNPVQRGFDSNRLIAEDATPAITQQIKTQFLAQLRDRNGNPPPAEMSGLRLLEKTPKNALRVPFLRAIFPDALFIYLYREPHENISSILEGWKSGRFVTYPQLPDWQQQPWSFLLIPEWRSLANQSLAEIAATQWQSANQQLLEDLAQLPAERCCAVTYADLIADPQAQAKRLCAFAGIEWDQDLPADLPLSKYTLTPPDPNKWKRNEAELAEVLPLAEAIATQSKQFIAQHTGLNRPATDRPSPSTPIATPSPAPTPMPASSELAPADEPQNPEASLRSVHTTNLPTLLEQLGISLMVSTYQTGKLIAVRADNGSLNTHFRAFKKPMGIVANPSRLALGTQSEVWEFRNVPDVARKLEPVGKHDACYLPRHLHTTGDIDIHEMAWADDGELWIVNTRFSALCTLHPDYSFVPRWRPAFVTALAPEDRCHLNGLGMMNGQPKYVTALGKTNTGRGWRENKANGGILMDVETQEILLQGLSMPHSPRWYGGQLWVLESGKGSLAVVDLKTGTLKTVAQLPGFTRGIDFCGQFAFIGLSQVRETAVFSGIPITETLKERICGVWVVDLQTGQTVAFLKFEDAVQEIFAVQVLNGIRFPDLINDDETLIGSSYVLPDEALADVPKAVRAIA